MSLAHAHRFGPRPNFNIKTGEIVATDNPASPPLQISKRTASSIARRWIYDLGTMRRPQGNECEVYDCDGTRHILNSADVALVGEYLDKQEERIRTYLGVNK